MLIRDCDAPLGTEVTGVDVKRLDDPSFAAIERAFNERGVLAIRGQALGEADQIVFSRRFGELETMKVYTEFVRPGYPEVFVVSNILEDGKPIGLQEAGRVWHTDGSYRAEPSLGSLLYAREIPAAAGRSLGDTLFASMSAAYDALPEATKRRIEGMKAVHRLDNARGEADRKQLAEVEHPVVRIHPATGRKCLYVNRLFTSRLVGVHEPECHDLLEELLVHATEERFVYRHRWAAGDLVMWDNCATQHLAIGDYALPQRRLMHRTTVRGGVPV